MVLSGNCNIRDLARCPADTCRICDPPTLQRATKDLQPPPSPLRATKDKLRLREGSSTPFFALTSYEGRALLALTGYEGQALLRLGGFGGQAPNTRRTFSLTF
ncbi:hypothetical protein IIA15_04720 [candidate division TA06 bacterium]|nr:hypothetical protein [candidate division TA06 bacterium]